MTPSLHNYLSTLREEGADPAYITAVQKNVASALQRGLPPLLSLRHLAHAVDVPYGYLLGIVTRKSDEYRIFSIRKRSGGKRFICVPNPLLLKTQKWIHRQILSSQASCNAISIHATAYGPECNHIRNASQHLRPGLLVKMDLTCFFEAISERQVFHVFHQLGYRRIVALVLARICTRVLPRDIDYRAGTGRWQGQIREQLSSRGVIGHLPQGAPTSPSLANLVCIRLDAQLASLSAEYGYVYTRYSDDLTFSTGVGARDEATKFIRAISRIVTKFGFNVNENKTRVATGGSRMIVTGLSVSEPILRLPRAYKEKLRQELYFLSKFGIASHCEKIGYANYYGYLLRLEGRIRYAINIEQSFGLRQMHLFSKAVPNFLRFT